MVYLVEINRKAKPSPYRWRLIGSRGFGAWSPFAGSEFSQQKR